MIPRLTGFGEVACRTMAIETSMKSSAFGFLLAKLHFGEYAARVPAAVSVVWMALTGSILAVIWRQIPVNAPKVFDRTLKERYPPFEPKKAWAKLTGKKSE
jgi:BASS family bile acid:Na+ symporter